MEAVHRRVRGRLPSATRAFPAGTPYDAHDPELALWVHASLVGSALLAYESFVAPLGPAQAAAFVVARAALRRAVPLLPEHVRVWPGARTAAGKARSPVSA